MLPEKLPHKDALKNILATCDENTHRLYIGRFWGDLCRYDTEQTGNHLIRMTVLSNDTLRISDYIIDQAVFAEACEVGDVPAALCLSFQSVCQGVPARQQGLSSCQIMGILNVTPDSFSDGGQFYSQNKAIDYAHQMIAEGAQWIDIGGESTRPGAEPISPEKECERVIPVVTALAQSGVKISVDTRHALVMQEAILAGAKVINDISALTHDPQAVETVCRHQDVRLVLMHMQGSPGNMQDNPYYRHVVCDIYDYLQKRIDVCEQAGIAKDRIIMDPGIGFGKNFQHNLILMQNIGMFAGLGLPILVGASRKSFIGMATNTQEPGQRLGGSVAAALAAWQQGATWLRVHDVAATRQALQMWHVLTDHAQLP